MNNKTSIHLSSFCDNWNDDLEKYIYKAKEIGFDSVEMPLFDARSFEVKKYLNVLKDTKLLITTGNAITCETDIASVDKTIREKGIEYLKIAIDKSLSLNSQCLNGVLYEPWGVLDTYTNENRKYLVQSLNTIDEYLNQVNFKINLELINRYEGNRLNNINQGLFILNEVDSKNINLHIDTFHMNIEETNIWEAIVKGGDKIGYVHFSENNRSAIGTGSIDFIKIIEALNRINYQGTISIESFISTKGDIGKQIKIWNESLFKSNIEMIEFSYKYLKKILKRSKYAN